MTTHRSTYNARSVRIDAPITINAQLGMDEQAIAEEVQKALEQQQVKAKRYQRVGLYDA